MWRPISIAIASATVCLLALVLWHVEMKATAVPPQKPDYAITSNSYLPIQRLEPVY